MRVDLLFIDDEPGIQRIVSIYCRKKGVSCEVFGNADDAITYVESAEGSPQNYWVDMGLAGGCEEAERFYDFLNESGHLKNFKFVTGGFLDEGEALIEKTGCPYMLKPLDIGSELDALKSQSNYK